MLRDESVALGGKLLLIKYLPPETSVPVDHHPAVYVSSVLSETT